MLLLFYWRSLALPNCAWSYLPLLRASEGQQLARDSSLLLLQHPWELATVIAN